MFKFLHQISPFNNCEPKNRYLLLIKTIIKYIVIYALGLLLAYLSTVVVRKGLNYKPFGDKQLGENAHLLLEHYGHGFCILVAVIFVKIESKHGLQSLGLTRKIWQVLIGFIISVVALYGIVFILVRLGQMSYLGVNPKLNYLRAGIFIGGYFIYSLAEETLCRGFVENRIRHRFNLHVCVWISFALFCLPHIPALFDGGLLYGTVGLINLLLISYIFSLMLDEFDNIYVCSGFHCLWYVLSSTLIESSSGHLQDTAILSFDIKDNILTGNGNLSAGLITVVILTFLLTLFVTLVKLKEYLQLKKRINQD